jgi:hypothetical protein
MYDYDMFWENLSPNTSVEVLVRMLAVFYTGASSSDSTKHEPQVSSVLALYEEIMQAVDFTAYNVTASSLILLQGFLLMNTFRVSELSPFSAFGFLPQTIRSAQSLKLHFDKDTGNGIDSDTKRLIWWHLVYLDVESTISNGLQSIIRSDSYTSQLPSIYLEEPFSADGSLSNTSVATNLVSPMMLAMQSHWQCASRMQSWFERIPMPEEVIKFSRDMQKLLSLLDDDPSNEWPSTYIKMQVDRAYCMLGLRFWQLDQFKGTDCQSEVVR